MDSNLEKKYYHLQLLFKEMQQVIIAFSGGVDSMLLLKVGTDTLGQNCLGVLGVSPSLSKHELKAAIDLANEISAKLEIINTHEMKNVDYLKNDSRRCFYCKYELFSYLKIFAEKKCIKYIIDGSNMDDIGDYRPGMEAANALEIRSPLIEASITKSEVRELSRYLNLSTWEKPAQPCLASRIAYGQKISLDLLGKIDQAEEILKDRGYQIVRVRYLGDHVSVEVGKDEVSRLHEKEEMHLLKNKIKEVGFSNVVFDKSGYESGKLNKHLTIM